MFSHTVWEASVTNYMENEGESPHEYVILEGKLIGKNRQKAL